MSGNPLELFRKFFGAVRAIFWLWGSFLDPDILMFRENQTCTNLRAIISRRPLREKRGEDDTKR